jgi:hypothetical protein
MTYIPEYVNADAFGRTRISEPFTLFDNSFRYSDNILKWDTVETNNSGNVAKSFNSAEGVIDLDIGTSAGDQIIRETKKVFPYQPGKSLFILNTFTMGDAQTGLRQRVGYYGANNGIFLEQDDDTIYFVKRNNGTDTRISQSSWSEDKFDGTGGSGVTLDLTKSQIFWVDIEWLGVGSVRCGFVINGTFYTCHIFHHANLTTSTYMTTACLPIRYEITNTTATSSASQMKQICSSVISEGGFTMKNTTRSASSELGGRSLGLAGTAYPIVSIRLREDRLDSVVVPAELNCYGEQSTPFKYSIWRGSTITGGTWTNTDNDSAVDYNISATAISGGLKILEGIFRGQTTFAKTLFDYDSALQLTRTISGTTGETFTLAITGLTNNDEVTASLSWMEHTT